MNRWKGFVSQAGCFALCALAACGGARASADAAMDASAEASVDAGTDRDMPPPPEDAGQYDGGRTHRHEVSISVELQPGQEVTRCTVLRLGNTGAEFVRRVYANLGDASHHLIFYKSAIRTEQTTPRDCNGFSGIRSLDSLDPPILIAQQRETTLQMPTNVGLPIDPDEYVRMEFHAVNLGRTPMTATARVLVDTVDQTVPLAHANLMFWGNTRISIPPMATHTVDFFHTPLPNARIFGLTSHTHHFGTRATIHVATGTRMTTPGSPSVLWSNVTDGELLHESRNWSDPPLTIFDPPRMLAPGQGLHLRCEYRNTSSRTVRFGESVDEEMCFLWAYYYPAPRGLQLCAIGATSDNGVACFPPS
jgi:hypothetical protein